MKIAVIGLGLEGKDVINYFLKGDNEITLFDQKNEEELNFDGVNKRQINLVCGPDYLKNTFNGFDLIVRSPGIRPDVLKGVPITSAMKIFFENCPAKIIGVTGTKGKGTTSTLIYEILKREGKDVYLVGNIGKPYLEILPKLNKESIVVMEMSSFQLFDLDRSPNIAVVLNITLDHMDWHTSRDEYVNSKVNIVSHQSPDDFAVINSDYETPKSFANKTNANVYYFSREKKVDGAYVKDRKIILNIGSEEIVGSVDELQLKGEHNFENVTAAIVASKLAGANINAIRNGTFDFKGLEHRLELVRTLDEVSFYNDSFSTNPQTTIAGIKAFKEPLTLILGGSDKGLDYSEMALEIVKSKNVDNIFLIGQIADLIMKSLVEAGFTGQIINLGMNTNMTEIVNKSYEVAKKKGVVLLSPATASFGMFENYKDRGKQFKDCVKKL